MGKDTDKMYITHSEWATLDFGHGGYKARKTGKEFKRLPFSCCSLSLTPFDTPRCTRAGHVFDLMNIVPWLKKHGTNPVTGEAMSAQELIPLHFHKNQKGVYHDPVTYKVFTENTHIVAVEKSGNVYAADTIEELNAKTKSWRDLLTDEPFTRKDLITIQDPHNLTGRDINSFHYVRNEADDEADAPEERKRKLVSRKINLTSSGSTSRVIAELLPSKKAEAPITPSFIPKKSKNFKEAHYSTNAASAAFTSMGAIVVTENKRAQFTDEEYVIRNVKEKGYAQIKTNMGDINIELFCGDTPKTCYNFIMLAKAGSYKDVPFHRLIKSFMVQGGDPTGTGKGGKSYFGTPFEDEFKSNLSHDSRGILSMANKGKGTNTSQFFITFQPCKHLDNKHTVFGQVVGGLEVLSKIERVATDEVNESPLTPITMLDVEVFVDPYENLTKELASGKKVLPEKKAAQSNIEVFSGTTSSSVVGKYLQTAVGEGASTTTPTGEPQVPRFKKPKTASSGFGNFDSW